MSGSGRTIPIGAAELRAIRERESVLEQTLARLTGVDTATVERIENGETPLSTLEPDQIRQWAKTLGVTPARLTGQTPQEGEGATTVIRRMRTERDGAARSSPHTRTCHTGACANTIPGNATPRTWRPGSSPASPSRSTPAWKS